MLHTPTFGGRGGRSQSQNGFAGGVPSPVPYIQLPTTSGAFPPHHSAPTNPYPMSTHSPTSPFPFDPNDPMAAMMAMQAMGGLPQLPGIPSVPVATVTCRRFLHTVLESWRTGTFPPRHRLKPPCKDYDTKGFCLLGDTCPYEHGTDHLVVPSKNEGKTGKAPSVEYN